MAPYHQVTSAHPSHTVAFGETIQYKNNENTDETIIALLTSSDAFPPLQPSASIAGKQAQEDREWQLILPRDADINEGLTISSSNGNKNVTGTEDGFDNDDTASNWQRVEYQKLSQSSFAEIAARAGEDHSPIPNDRFFMSDRQQHKGNNSQRAESKADDSDKPCPSTTLQKQDDFYEAQEYYCYGHQSPDHHYDVVKASRKSVVLRKHYALRRKRNTIEVVFRRRMQSLPETLARQENKNNKIKEQVQIVQAKLKAAENDLCPTVWSRGQHNLQWNGTSFSHIIGSKKPKQKGRKKGNNMTKAEYVRTQLVNGMIEHGMIPKPTSGNQTTTRRQEEEHAIDNYARQISWRYFQSYGRAHHQHSKEWLYYGIVLIALRDDLKTRYQKLLKDLAYDQEEKRGDKALLTMLYKELPRSYYKPGNRKYRKQHIRFLVQNRSRNEDL